MYSSYNNIRFARLASISFTRITSNLATSFGGGFYAVAKRNHFARFSDPFPRPIGEPVCARHSVVNRWTFFADYTTSSCIVAAMFSGTFRISGRIASQRRNNCVRTTYPYHSHNNLNSCFVNDYRHIASAYGLCNGVVRQQNSSECVYFESKR